MGKVKSALFLTLVTVILAGLCFMCAVSFNYGGYKGFRSILSSTQKDALLGNDFTSGKDTAGDYEDSSGNTYVGGGYVVAYYPEGVLSAEAYEEELEAREAAHAALVEEDAPQDEINKAEDAVKEYTEGYAKKGSLYFKLGTYDAEEEKNRGIAKSENGAVTVDEKFDAAFKAAVSQLKTRIRELDLENARISVRDGYTVEVFLPSMKDTATQAAVFNTIGRVGEFDLRYGTSTDSAEQIAFGEGESIRDYVRSAHYVSNGGTPSVAVSFTTAGRETVSGWTASLADSSSSSSSSNYIFFYVGDEPIIQLPVSQQIDESTLYISGSYTASSAEAVALAIDTALNGETTDLSFSVGEVYVEEALFGSLALTLLYVAFGALALSMLVFFFVRYHGLGLVQLYSFLIYLLPMILLVWGIPFLHIGIETFLAVLFGALLLSVSQLVIFESARKEYAQGKTIATSVKNAYKRCLWGIIDLHVVLALISFVTYFIALGELATFAFTFGLATVLSGVIALTVGRFHWACILSFAKDKGKFCNFKREELEDE